MRCLYAALGFFIWVGGIKAEDLVHSGKTTNWTETIKREKKLVQNTFVEIAQKGIQLSAYTDKSYKYDFSSNNVGTNDFNGKQNFNLYAVKLALEEALIAGDKTHKAETVGIEGGKRKDLKDIQTYNNRSQSDLDQKK